MPSEILAKLRSSQAGGSTPAPSGKTPSATGGSSVLAELRKQRAAAEAPAKPEAPHPLATGPRISELQKETIRPATPQEAARAADPRYQAEVRKIADSTPEARTRAASNDPILRTFVTKTLPSIRKYGENMANSADVNEARTGLSARGVRAAGNIAMKTADTLTDFVARLNSNAKTAPGHMLDVALGVVNLGAIPFTVATESIGGAIPVVGEPIKKGIEGAAGGIMESTGYALENAYAGYHEMFFRKLSDPNFANPLAISPDDPNLPTVKEIGGLLGITAAMGVLHAKTAQVKARFFPDDPAYGAANVLDLTVSSKGDLAKLTKDSVDAAYKEAVWRATESKTDIQQKMDVLNVAHRILLDKVEGNMAGTAKWGKAMTVTQEMLPDVVRNVEETSRAISNEADLRTALDAKDVTARQRSEAKARLLGDEAGRLAYEQEISIGSTKNDAERASVAESRGATFERDLFSSSDQPAGYQDGRIIFNEGAIRNTVDAVFKGGEGRTVVRIKTGEGATTSFKEIVKEAGESPMEFRAKYEDALFDHELAHHELEVRSPEIAAKRARMEAATTAGDFVTANKLRKELELAAHTEVKITREKAPEAIRPNEQTAIDLEVRRFEKSEEFRARHEALQFATEAREAAYREWKQLTKGSERRSADWEGLKSSTRRSDVLRRIEDGLSRGESNNEMLDAFRDRLRKEVKLREEATAERAYLRDEKAKQQQLLPKREKSIALRENATKRIAEIAKEEIRNEMDNRLAKAAREKELALLKERIKSRDLTAAERGKLRNVYEQKLEDLKRMNEMKSLKQRIEDRHRVEQQRKKAEALREKIATGKASQQEISDYMRANRVPNAVRGKFITDLKNAKTPADAAKVVKEIQREYNEYQRKRSVGRIQKILKAYREQGTKKTVGVETQQALAKIQGYMKMSRSEIMARIENLVTETRAKIGEGGLLPEDVAHEIELLQMGGLDGQSARQTLRTEAELRSLMKNGRTLRQDKLVRQADKLRSVIDTTVETLTGSREFDPTVPLEKVQKNIFQRAMQRVSDKLDRLEIVDELASRLGKPFHTFMKEATSAVAEAKRIYEVGIRNRMYDKLAELYGKEFQLEAYKMTNDQVNLGEMTRTDGSKATIRLTRSQMIDVYMKLKNDRTAKNIRSVDGNNFSQEIIDRINETLTREDKALGDYLIAEGYAKQFSALRSAVAKHDDLYLGERKNYSGKVSYLDEKVGAEDLQQMSALDLMNENAQYNVSRKPKFLETTKPEVMRALRFSNDVVADFLRYSERAQHYIHVGGYAKEMDAMLRDPAFTETIRNRLGEKFLQTLKDQTKDDVMKPRSDDFGQTGLVTSLTNNVGAYLVNRWSVAVGQFSAPLGGAGAAELLGIRGVDYWRSVANWKKNNALLERYVPELELRSNEPLPDTGVGRKLAVKSRLRLFVEKVRKVMGQASGVEWADKVTARATANGIFQPLVERYLKEGKSKEQAYRLAGVETGKVINEIQPSNLNIAKGAAFKQPGVREFLALKQAPTKIALTQRKILRLYRDGKITGKQAGVAFAYSLVFQAVAYELLKRGYSAGRDVVVSQVAGAFGREDAAKEKLKSAKERLSGKEIVKGMGLGTLNSMTSFPVVGDLMNVLVQNLAFGKNYEYRPLIVDTLTSDLMNVIQSTSSGNFSKAGLYALRGAAASVGAIEPFDILGTIISLPKEKKGRSK